NLEEKINKMDAYYAVRDGNFRRERFHFFEKSYFQDLRSIGVTALNDPFPRPLTLRPTNDYDISEFLREKTYDLVWVEYFYLADRYLNEIRRYQPWAKVYVDSVDLHYLRLERQATHLDKNVKFVVNAKQERVELGEAYPAKVAEHYDYASQVKTDELKAYARADMVIASSADDQEKLRERFPHRKILLLPNLYEEPRAKTPPREKRRGLVFVGNFDHHPNVTAAIFLKHEVAALLDPEIHGPLHLVGNNPLYLIKTMQKYGAFAGSLKVTGYVKEISPYLDRALIALAPVFFDSGMSTKIGQALGAGVPLVTTPLGAELMGLTHGENCLVGENAEGFAAQIKLLQEDATLWEKIRAGGLAFLGPSSGAGMAEKIRENFLASFSLEKIRSHQIAKALPRKKPLALPPAKFAKVAKPDITVLLVTYNQWAVTELCLRSLAYAQKQYPGVKAEFLLVDNASQDGTPDFAAKIPNLRVIKNKKNLGFAAGNNVGIRAAKGRDVVLLNNDTVVAPNWLELLSYHAHSIPDLGILGPSTNTETAQQIAGARYNSVEEFFAYNEQLASQNGGMWDVITKVSGLCFYLPRHTIERVGLLDEGFGIGYFEDDDYCMRVSDAGLKLVCAKDVYVHHFGNMSFEGNSMNRIKILEKGMTNFIFKYGKRAMAYLEANHKNTQLQFVNPKEKSSF
ncbi:MAG: glycosyltransferase, partial [Bdellovibrionota bacterium]